MAVHRHLNPPAIPAPRGYSHVVETKSPSRTIYLSGQLGMTPDGKFAGAQGDFRAQAIQCFENIKAALAAVGDLRARRQGQQLPDRHGASADLLRVA